jgi:hypothetical protein
MWTIEVSRKTTAKKESTWKIWSDVPNWNIWDSEVETAELFGQFQIGTKGILKPKGGPKAKFRIIEFTKLKSFTIRSFLPFCKIDFIHSITEKKEGLEITHKVVMTGFMTFFFSKVIGNKIKVALPIAVERLIELAEKS